jgi:carbon storage regulator
VERDRFDSTTGGEREEAGMLVLERKVQEGFWIEDRIFVKILGIGRRRVKLGIEAPSDSTIMRDELRTQAASKNGTREGIEKEGRNPARTE